MDRPYSWRKIQFSKTDNALIQGGLIGEDHNGNFLTGGGSDEKSNRVTITRLRFDDRRPTFRNITVSVPLTGATLPILSPKGDKLAWLIVYESDRTLTSYYNIRRVALWITSATGKIFGLSAPVLLPDATRADSLRWMPDGRHISFLKGETLYKAAVP